MRTFLACLPCEASHSVEATAVGAVAVDGERTGRGRAVGEDRVEVGVHHDVVVARFGLVAGEKALADRGAEVDEFAGEADRLVVGLHDFGRAGDASGVGRAAVEVYQRSEVLEEVFKHGHGINPFCSDG